jgi:hypothetical protein
MGNIETKTRKVLQLLKQLGPKGLTPKDVYRDVGTMRLAAIVFNLKRDGHLIETQMETDGKNRYARYIYLGEVERG